MDTLTCLSPEELVTSQVLGLIHAESVAVLTFNVLNDAVISAPATFKKPPWKSAPVPGVDPLGAPDPQ